MTQETDGSPTPTDPPPAPGPARSPEPVAEPTRLPPLHIRRRLALAALGPLAFLLFQLAAQVPGTVERLYASGPGPALVQLLALLTGWTSVALVEVVALALVVRHGWAGLQAVRRVRRSTDRIGRAAAGWTLRLVADAGVLVALFYVLWGFNYARPTLEARLGLEEVRTPEVEELRTLAQEALAETNRLYRELHGTDDTGTPTTRPRSAAERRQLLEGLEQGWQATGAELGMPLLGRSYGQPKTLTLARGLLFKLGILGVYIPFTAEPVTNARNPGLILPRNVAHEQAHQRGVAPEDEANFMAAMVTLRSPQVYARYSGWRYLLVRLTTDLMPSDPEAAGELIRGRLPGVQRDEWEVREFLRSMEGPVNRATEQVNHAFLRGNRVEGGIRSYGLVTRLLVAWARQNGGSLKPG